MPMERNNFVFTAYTSFMKSKIKFALTTLEAVPSLPIPTIINDKPYLTIFFFIGKRLNKNEKMKIHRPIIKFIININTYKIVNYINYYVIDEFPESDWEEWIGEFPHDSISEMTLAEYKQDKNKLIQRFDGAINDLMTGNNNFELKDEFSKNFYRICEPALLPFIKQAAPNFIEWLQK